MKYDYIIVGSGLFGAVCAHELNKRGKKILVLEKREHIGGNIYTENVEGINVHKYGAHIFHTNDKLIWDYINTFAEFNRFTNSPLASYEGKLYNLPFNMNTFYQLWGVQTPQDAKAKIDEQRLKLGENEKAKNLEEQALSLVGKDIYEIFIKGYTEKQWGCDAATLPSFIINRLPVRFTFDNNYFSDNYQGIPVGGYTQIIEKMLEGVEVKTNIDYLENKAEFSNIAEKIIYTGPIDAYYDYCFGELEYRSLKFETTTLDIDNYQGNAVVNYTERHVPYTRIIEHKHFDYVDVNKTIITKEYPLPCEKGNEPYYPINNEKNMELFKKYRSRAKEEGTVIFGGRLAEYKYYDMHQVIRSAFNLLKTL